MNAPEKLPLRKDVPLEYTWATEDLYESDQAFLTDLQKFRESIQEIAAFGDTLTESGQNLLAFYQKYNEQIRVSNRLYNYAMLKNDEDTTNPVYQDFKAKISGVFVDWSSATSFLAPKLMQLPSETLTQYYQEVPELLFYQHAIDNILRMKEHTLDEQGEALLALSMDLNDIPDTIYGYLSYADLTFEDVVVDGKTYPLSHGSFVSLQMNQNRAVRKAAFENFYREYFRLKNSYASILQGQLKTLSFQAKARKYPTTLEAALDVTEVDPAVYHNLLTTVHENIHYMHDYVRLRKKLLKVDELHMYDVYAPLVAESAAKITFEEAKENVLAAMSIYGEEYLSVLKSGFDNRWIDRYENIGKRSGAYSSGALVHPFVLLNHTDDLDSEFTLAHEMGHAMHSYLSNTSQEPIYAEYVIFVAEVASTCNEALLMQYLLKKTTDKKERAALINYFLEQFKGTLYRQAMFAEFELRINELYAAGETLTADLLSKEYRRLCEFYFGPDMVLDDEIAVEWARIPHFYYNYYVFQYATGFSAAIALSTKILNEGQPAIDRYLNFLRSGATKDPISLLRGAGVDMASPEPVRLALELFGSLIKELEEMFS